MEEKNLNGLPDVIIVFWVEVVKLHPKPCDNLTTTDWTSIEVTILGRGVGVFHLDHILYDDHRILAFCT